MKLEKISFSDLPGWTDNSDNTTIPALQKSCPALQKRGTAKPVPTKGSDWTAFCSAIDLGWREAVEANLQPYRLISSDESRGLFTGYYEPLLHASRTRTDKYNVPIYKRPNDMVQVDLGDFRDSLKGQKITGRVDKQKLVPYYARADIARGVLANKNNELLWADSEVDVFFLEIQGSGRAELPDGQRVRIGYDAQNGYSYTAIGRVLKDRGAIESPVTMTKIKDWLAANPDKAREVLDQNESYVFFRELKQDGAVGAANVTLTPQHSLAIDPAYYSYHLPLWLSTRLPGGRPFNSLMMTQDTGGAIKGPIRGDVFWGFGAEAEEQAGSMQQPGALYILLPKSVETSGYGA